MKRTIFLFPAVMMLLCLLSFSMQHHHNYRKQISLGNSECLQDSDGNCVYSV